MKMKTIYYLLLLVLGYGLVSCYDDKSTYDTKEMSVLIDGTVADAKELGIDTITPAELQEMKERWGI